MVREFLQSMHWLETCPLTFHVIYTTVGNEEYYFTTEGQRILDRIGVQRSYSAQMFHCEYLLHTTCSLELHIQVN